MPGGWHGGYVCGDDSVVHVWFCAGGNGAVVSRCVWVACKRVWLHVVGVVEWSPLCDPPTAGELVDRTNQSRLGWSDMAERM